MVSTDERQTGGGWMERLVRAAIVAAIGAVGLGASCVAPVGPEGDGGDRTDASSATDIAQRNCRSIAGAESCRRQAGCQWLTATCEGGRVIGGCFAGSGWRDASLECPSQRDAGGGDVAAGPEACDGAGTEAGCRARDGCRWWTAYCGGQLVEARCIDREASPEAPACSAADAGDASAAQDTGARDAATLGSDVSGASDASRDAADLDAGVYCRMHSNESDCASDTRCKWWVDSCDGYVIDEKCVSKQESPTSTTCRQIPRDECHDIDSEGSCQPPNCEWVTEGCGSGPSDAAEVTACLPEGTCKTDTDCPSDHRCVKLWTDVCYGSSCQACGGETSRCVPKELLNP